MLFAKRISTITQPNANSKKQIPNPIALNGIWNLSLGILIIRKDPR